VDELERPEMCDDEMLRYLDDLREAGPVNMFGAAPWLQAAFPELSRGEARLVLAYWMKTFPRSDDEEA
jgi:hypothetical protein